MHTSIANLSYFWSRS